MKEREYIMVEDFDHTRFVVYVNERLKESWDLVGGVSAVDGSAFWYYHQAMIREKETD